MASTSTPTLHPHKSCRNLGTMADTKCLVPRMPVGWVCWVGLILWRDERMCSRWKGCAAEFSHSHMFFFFGTTNFNLALFAFLESPSLLYKLAMALTVLREGVFCIVAHRFPSQLLQPLLSPSIPKLPQPFLLVLVAVLLDLVFVLYAAFSLTSWPELFFQRIRQTRV